MQQNKIDKLYNSIKLNIENMEKYRKNKIGKRVLISVIICFIMYLIIGLPLINRDYIYISYIIAGIVAVVLLICIISKLSVGVKTFSNISKNTGINTDEVIDYIKDMGNVSKLDEYAEKVKPLNDEIKQNAKVMRENNRNSFEYEYKTNVLSSIIKSVFGECEYKANEGLEYEIYSTGWENKINKYITNTSYAGQYESENRIETKLNNNLNLVVAEISSFLHGNERLHGRKILQGMSGYIKLPKSFNVDIKLKKHTNYLLGEKTMLLPSNLSFGDNLNVITTVQKDYFKTNIEVLDKLYDIEVNDKEKASEILNNIFLSGLSKLVEKYNMNFRFSISQDMLYIWFDVENKIFNPSVNHKISKKDIEKVYMSFENVKNIAEDISNLILNN